MAKKEITFTKPIAELLYEISPEQLAARIDHTLVTPWSDIKELERILEEYRELKLRCIILSPTLAQIARQITSGNTCIGSVAGFPFGYQPIEAKIKEIEDLVSYNVEEIDYVINFQKFILGQKNEVYNEAKAVVEICRETNITCKIIIETPALSLNQIAELVSIIAKTEPNFIKTSSGFGPSKTRYEDVLIIRGILEKMKLYGKIGIKAAGGIRTALQALTFISLGADIIGTSKPKAILDGFKELKEIYKSRGRG